MEVKTRASIIMEGHFDQTETDFLTCRPEDEFRPVDWRLRVARLVAKGGDLHPQRIEDPFVVATVHYLGYDDKDAPLSDEQLLANVAAAATFHGQGGVPRTEFEARLLAGMSPQSACDSVRLESDAAIAYEAIFFDICDRRGNDVAIRRVAFPPIEEPIAEDDTDTLLKLAAYHGGPAALSVLLRYIGQPRLPEPKRLRELTDRELADWLDWLNVRRWILGMTVSPKTTWEKLKLIEAVWV